MYVPPHFAETDLGRLHDLMRRFDFALLVASGADGAPEAAHIPFMLDSSQGPRGTLLAHMARANPLWRRFGSDREVLVVFQGPHGYVSPRWYTEPAAAVPTWNYAAVHAYGIPCIVEDPAEASAMLERLVDAQEAGRPRPWRMADARPGLIDAMARGIVAFEIPVDRLEGKLKISQNKAAEDRAGVVAALTAAGDDASLALAALMEELDAPAD